MTRPVDPVVTPDAAPTGIVRDEHGHTVHYPYDAEPFTVEQFDTQAAQQDAADWERGR